MDQAGLSALSPGPDGPLWGEPQPPSRPEVAVMPSGCPDPKPLMAEILGSKPESAVCNPRLGLIARVLSLGFGLCNYSDHIELVDNVGPG